MRKMKSRCSRWIRNVTLLVLAVFFSYLLYVFGYRAKAEPPAQVSYTTWNPIRYQTAEDFRSSIPKYYELDRLAFEGRESEKQYGTYVIPGLKSTRTLSLSDETSVDSCCSMTPQGIAVTGSYVMITAYCRAGKHNSVIYLLNKKTHRYIKQIVLPGRPHAGGIAYDPEHDRIWYSSHDLGIAQAVSIRMEDLENYRFERDPYPIATDSYYLYGVIRDSFLTVHDGYLYVGYYAGTEEGTLVTYEILPEGGLNRPSQGDLNLSMEISMVMPTESGILPSCVQGIAFYGDLMIASQSYGLAPSKLFVLPFSRKMEYPEERIIQEYVMPERMEQICIDGDQLYVIFESGAYAYRSSSFHIMDRALKINMKKVLEDMKQ